MLFLITYLFACLTVIGASLWASASDFRELKIPNVISLIALSGFFIAYVSQYFGLSEVFVFAPLLNHAVSCLIIFCLTLLLFVTRVLGAGDAKMASAYALWLPVHALPQYLIIMTLVGGLLGLLSIIIKRTGIRIPLQSKWLDTLKLDGSAVPYGIAIAVSFIFVSFELGYLSKAIFVAFLQ